MRKLVPLLESAAKSQLPDVIASWGVGVGAGVLEFPPQPAMKRAKKVMMTTQTWRTASPSRAAIYLFVRYVP
jgi:hypothetical protein